ncbi:DNA ligase D [Microvirga flavescens]|uniref:DNA ligase D n=1 Tax=Microvirga flavescens TaxID=2249811 RepID=UPI000DD91EE2|nr:DNA ligase D [Microvirga flavescens]
MAKLAAYRAKRDFTKTSEPRGGASNVRGASYVVQKHDATRLHYDFRLELDGALKSWAVAKGPSLDPNDKRLAIEVEDHPLDYGGFEGTIPEGQYGAGTVMLWDRGTWQPDGDPHKGLAKGHLSFTLNGDKLKGHWHLVRMHGKPRERQVPWLLIKGDDEYARAENTPDILDEEPSSVATGLSLGEIAAGTRPKQAQRKTRKAPRDPPASKKRHARSHAADPMPNTIEPCLATLVAKVPSGSGWLHEIKWDGYRLIAVLEDGRAKLLTRNGLDWTARFPGIAKAFADLPVETAIIDGEAIVEDERGVPDFSALQQALSNSNKGAADAAIFYAFDLLYLDGRDVRALPLIKRKEALVRCLAGAASNSVLRYSEHIVAHGEEMAKEVCRQGLEGVVSKHMDKPYRSGRNADWVKIKCIKDQEFVIAGFVPSTATKNAIGALVLGYNDEGQLTYAGRTGTGFTADLARTLFTRLKPLKTTSSPFTEKLTTAQRRGVVWVKPELVGQVEFRSWTADNLVRQAAFKGLREDRNAREVTREMPASPQKRSVRAMPNAATEIAGITLTHPDRVLWEDQDLTKEELAAYYLDIADWILPHIVERPLTLVRCPTGTRQTCFVQRHAWAGIDDAVHRAKVRDKDSEEEVVFVRDIRGVIALVQASALEIHTWGATLAKLERPDRLTFDFDPGEHVEWPLMIEAARTMRERLRLLGLESFLKLTGGKGLHVVVPLTPKAGWENTSAFARAMARTMSADEPERYTASSVKKERDGRIFIDYLRNNRSATAIAPYSPRARTGAPVATPIAWDELTPRMKPNAFSIATLPKRLKALHQDPWAQIGKVEQTLPDLKRPR